MKSFFKTLFASFFGALLALAFFFLIGFSIISSFNAKTEVSIPSSAILKLDFNESLAEQTSKESFNFDLNIIPYINTSSNNKLGILDAVKAVNIASQDPAIKLIYINPTNLAGDMTQLEELRKALENFKASGKPIVSYSENYSQLGYYLSSVGDKVYINPMGTNQLMGLSAQIMYLKDILDKIGVNVQLIRHGKYKSAGEQYITNHMSKANKEQQTVMLTSIWKELSEAICKSRNIDINQFNEDINNLSVITADQMVEAGLVDKTMTRDEMNKQLCLLFNVKNPSKLKMVSLSKYAKVKLKTNVKAKNKIAILYATGEIVDGSDHSKLATEDFIPLIRKVRKDSSIKAVVLRVNSPGGSAIAAELMRTELMLLQEDKPLILSFGNYAASGGYWISANCEKIFTDNMTLTGSIGVFSMIPEIGGVIRNKLHINPQTISTHRHADMMKLMRPFDKEETRYMQAGIEQVYTNFLSIVSNGRSMTTEKVDSIAQGRVWTGYNAIKIGLVDEIGGLNDALEYASEITGLEEYRLVSYPKQRNSISELMSNMNQAAANINFFSNATPEDIYNQVASDLEKSKGIYARIPYIMNISK
ncbi:MAG: signal peptide peptidase SppA [Bacteroidales bacterium]